MVIQVGRVNENIIELCDHIVTEKVPEDFI